MQISGKVTKNKNLDIAHNLLQIMHIKSSLLKTFIISNPIYYQILIVYSLYHLQL